VSSNERRNGGARSPGRDRLICAAQGIGCCLGWQSEISAGAANATPRAMTTHDTGQYLEIGPTVRPRRLSGLRKFKVLVDDWYLWLTSKDWRERMRPRWDNLRWQRHFMRAFTPRWNAGAPTSSAIDRIRTSDIRRREDGALSAELRGLDNRLVIRQFDSGEGSGRKIEKRAQSHPAN
jgi:hypothetical protein